MENDNLLSLLGGEGNIQTVKLEKKQEKIVENDALMKKKLIEKCKANYQQKPQARENKDIKEKIQKKEEFKQQQKRIKQNDMVQLAEEDEKDISKFLEIERQKKKNEYQKQVQQQSKKRQDQETRKDKENQRKKKINELNERIENLRFYKKKVQKLEQENIIMKENQKKIQEKLDKQSEQNQLLPVIKVNSSIKIKKKINQDQNEKKEFDPLKISQPKVAILSKNSSKNSDNLKKQISWASEDLQKVIEILRKTGKLEEKYLEDFEQDHYQKLQKELNSILEENIKELEIINKKNQEQEKQKQSEINIKQKVQENKIEKIKQIDNKSSKMVQKQQQKVINKYEESEEDDDEYDEDDSFIENEYSDPEKEAERFLKNLRKSQQAKIQKYGKGEVQIATINQIDRENKISKYIADQEEQEEIQREMQRQKKKIKRN